MKNTKEILTRVREVLSKVSTKLGRAELESGVLVEWEGELEVGKDLNVVTDEGMSPAPDGEHMTIEGLTITTADGVIEAISEPSDDDMESDDQEEEMEDESSEELESEEESEEEQEMDSDEQEDESDEADEDESEEDESEEEQEMSSDKNLIEELNEKVEKFSTELSERDEKIEDLESQLTEVAQTLSDLTNSHADALDLINKISKEPAVEEKSEEVQNIFNKTRSKSRAQEILSSR